jgi:hypothetical protein
MRIIARRMKAAVPQPASGLVLHPRRWRADDLCRWDEWKDKPTVEVLKSCTMLITEPNDFVAEVHDRMPVLNPKISCQRDCRVAQSFKGPRFGSSSAGAGSVGVCVWSD